MIEESFAKRLRLESLPGLRALRKAVREEERQVSYWRRLVQGRLDLVRAALAGDQPSLSRLATSVSAKERASGRRSPAFAKLVGGPMEHRPAKLVAVWDVPIPWDDQRQLGQVERTLTTIEGQLSSYRHDLHERIDACTAELAGRYRRDPGELKSLCPPGG